MSLQQWFIGLLLVVYAVTDEQTPDLPTGDEWPSCEPSFLEGQYSMIHKQYCDRFFACDQGTPYLMQCEDGFGYSPFRGCKLLHLVDCTDRPKLQKPRGNEKCPRLYGLFNDPRGCGRFFKCINGTATEDQCGEEYMYDDVEKICREKTNEEFELCKEATDNKPNEPAQPTENVPATELPTEVPGEVVTDNPNQPNLLGCVEIDSQTTACTWFQCPKGNILAFGDHARYPFPGNCHHFIICFRDGTIKIGGCTDNTAFDSKTGVCQPEQTVKACSSEL